MSAVSLLSPAGEVTSVPLTPAPAPAPAGRPPSSRVAYAAAHVIPRASAENTPGSPADLDWDATLAFRHHVWAQGLGVADAMDTAQRNMGLDPRAIRELITRSAAEAASVGGRLLVGVNTDEIEGEAASLEEIVAAYVSQLRHAEDAGAGAVIMASRHLARAARGPEDYARVYAEVCRAAGAPVVLHWLGEAFDASLAGYFGGAFPAAAETVLRIMDGAGDRVSGIKMSLLDASAEEDLRARLPEGVRMFTGDDFNYVGLIEGDGVHHSDALLGAFSTIAPLAARALHALDEGDAAGYRALLGPTEELSRQVFAAPTQFYKSGVAFMSWLNGHQAAYQMVGGLHSARSLPHLSRIVELANAAGALERPELAAERWHAMLSVNGVRA